MIAEVGANHNGDLGLAKELTNQLAEAGVDAVKFQLANPDELLSLDAFKAKYQVGGDNHEDVIEASRARQLSHTGHEKLKFLCDELGIEYLCTAFDLDSLQFLDRILDVSRFKVASGELLSVDLSSYIAESTKSAIVSTGMASEAEISEAIQRINPYHRAGKITLLHCVSNYPADYAEVNLNWMPVMRERYQVSIGYSDHTLGNEVALAAVALGASVIEKHVTIDRMLRGPDHKASATVADFADLVRSVRIIESALGVPRRVVSDAEHEIALAARKSIVSAKTIPAGKRLEPEDLCFKRPGTGFPPTQVEDLIGRQARVAIPANKVLRAADIT